MNKLITLKGEKIVIDAQKVIYWPKEELLIVSDIHLGKASHFRKNGLAVPGNVHAFDLQKLSNLIFDYNPRTVCFLGDLFHSQINTEWNLFEEWMSDFQSVKFILVKGNHDILDERIYEQSCLCIVDELELKPFLLTHEKVDTQLYNLSGHLHPGIRINGAARQGITMPCFYFSQNHGILPAFGDFTGIAKIRALKNDCIYGIIEDQVIEISNK